MASTGGAGRVWLDVPFSEKDEAKRLGARWDGTARRWYAPRQRMPGLERWAALPPVPDLLPGEDRSFGAGLFVDLVPASCWFTNVRSCVPDRDWDRIRRMVLGRAGRRCEVCGRGEDRDARPRPRWLEVHERWAYDRPRLVQSLRRLICLCTDCHTTTHLGLAQLRGLDTEALAHLRAVTGMSEREAQVHVDSAFNLWQQRSRHDWTLDLGMLTSAGVTVTRPEPAARRSEVAAEQTAFVRPLLVDADDDAAERAAAVELVRAMWGDEVPDGVVGAVRVRLPGGRFVEVDPSEV